MSALNKLKKLIESVGIKHKSLALKAGISDSFISDILSGGYKVTLQTFLKIVNALNQRLSITGTDNPNRVFYVTETEMKLPLATFENIVNSLDFEINLVPNDKVSE